MCRRLLNRISHSRRTTEHLVKVAKHSKTKSDISFKIVIYIVCSILALLSLIPFAIMLVNATRSSAQIQGSALSFIPGSSFMHNLKILKTKEEFRPLVGMKNSFIISVGVTVLNVYFSSLTAYAIHTYKWKLKKAFFGLIMAIMMLSRMISDLSLPVPSGYVLISDAIENGEVREEALAEISDLITRLSPRHTFAVRSSALNEDGSEASFAGQYETLTDVPVEGICNAVIDVVDSAESARVEGYTDHIAGGSDTAPGNGTPTVSKIAVVIQRFVKPEFAGVLFTSDVISGKDDKFVGNYVRGEGEKLVSGAENAEEFRIGAIKYSYDGPAEFKRYAKQLGNYCKKIRRAYGVPMDIEWAVSKKKVYILQARPITTLRRLNLETYEVNGTGSGYKMLTRTNVGEIFQKPVTPMTFSALE